MESPAGVAWMNYWWCEYCWHFRMAKIILRSRWKLHIKTPCEDHPIAAGHVITGQMSEPLRFSHTCGHSACGVRIDLFITGVMRPVPKLNVRCERVVHVTGPRSYKVTVVPLSAIVVGRPTLKFTEGVRFEDKLFDPQGTWKDLHSYQSYLAPLPKTPVFK